MLPYVTKGSHIRAEWMAAKTNPLASVSGQQLKFEVQAHTITGIVKHVRGDHPTQPTIIRLFVDPDPGTSWTGPTTNLEGCTCGHPHVEVNPDHLIEVL